MVIGPDGREYGPAGLDTLRQWQAEGRIHGSTPVRTSQGITLSIGQLMPVTALPPVVAPPHYGYPQASYVAPAPKSSSQAPIAIFLLLGGMGSCIVLCLLSIAIPNFQKAKEASERLKQSTTVDTKSFAAMQNARMIVSALAGYAEMSNAHLPALGDSKKVQDAISPYIPDEGVRKDVGNYEFNPELSDRVPGRMVNPEQVWLVRDPRPNDVGQNAVCTVDGSCLMLTPSQFKYRCLPYHAEYQTTSTANSAAPHRSGR
jgi:hypothetical protein